MAFQNAQLYLLPVENPVEKGLKRGAKQRFPVEKASGNLGQSFSTGLVNGFPPLYPLYPQGYPQGETLFETAILEFSTGWAGVNPYY
jgi:hypothetical protein